jgi:hypothetical protein
MKNVFAVLSSLLSHTDVDRWQSERCRFHYAAAGISNEQACVPEQTPVLNGWQVDKEVPIAAFP